MVALAGPLETAARFLEKAHEFGRKTYDHETALVRRLHLSYGKTTSE